MTGILVLAILVVAFVVVVSGILMSMNTRRRRSEELRKQFGPEYEHAVEQYGDDGLAEKELAARALRVEQLRIRPLAPDQSAQYAEAWRSTQTRFVDDPSGAISQADALVEQVMQARGYPMSDFEQRAADISVDHPEVVERYRRGSCVCSPFGTRRSDDGRSSAGNVHYRALFDDLIETRDPSRAEVRQ